MCFNKYSKGIQIHEKTNTTYTLRSKPYSITLSAPTEWGGGIGCTFTFTSTFKNQIKMMYLVFEY